MNRYTKSFALTFVLYAVILISFLYSFEDKKQLKSSQKKGEQVVKFTIIQEPKVVEEKKERIIKKKEVKKVVEKFVKKELITKKIKPKVVEKKKKIIVKKKEVKKTVEKSVKKEQIVKPKQVIVKQQIKQNTSVQKNTINHQDLLKKRKVNQNRYYSKIKETINKNKSYPKMAIKREIEGIVKIEFTISKHGELLSFNIIEGKRVFKKSITQAVKNSFPITPPKDVLFSNTALSLMIDYKLY